MKITGKATIRNRFDIVCRDIKTGEEQKYRAHNIVLDSMWSRLVNFNSFFTHIHFGTGTGTLSPARTSLFNRSGGKVATTVEAVRALPTSRRMGQIVLQPEEYVGHELTEVGVAYGTDLTNLVTHAFIEDSEGNPISIVKTDTMVVTIYATIFFELGELTSMYGGQWRWVQPLANNDLLSYLMGGSYPTQSFYVTSVPSFVDGRTANGFHDRSDTITVANWSKDLSARKVTTPVRRLGINTGNGAIRGFGLGSNHVNGTFRGQFPIPGVFAGHTIEGESIGIGDGQTKGFNPAWPQISDATVYVDGIPVDSDITIYEDDVPGRNIAILLTNISIAGSSDLSPLLVGRDVTIPGGGSSHYLYAKIPDELAPEDITDVSFYSGSGDTFVMLTVQSRATPQDEWTTILSNVTTGTHAISIPTGHTYLRFLFVNHQQTGFKTISGFALNRTEDRKIFVFDTPPPEGAVITADYTVPYIPKDENHVLDLQCSIQWGEG